MIRRIILFPSNFYDAVHAQFPGSYAANAVFRNSTPYHFANLSHDSWVSCSPTPSRPRRVTGVSCTPAPWRPRAYAASVRASSFVSCGSRGTALSFVWDSRLIESPHIAALFTTLNISLSYPALKPAENDAPENFRKSTNVRRCTIHGSGRSGRNHATSTPHVLDFIRWQKLTALRVSSLEELPSAVVALLVCSAPLMVFAYVNVSINIDLDDYDTPTSPPQLRQLDVTSSDSVCDVLARSDHSYHTTNLRRLSVEDQIKDRLIESAVACSLEHIRFGMSLMSSKRGWIRSHMSSETSTPLQFLPPFPVLRSVDFWKIQENDEILFFNTVSALLTSRPPNLEKLTVTYFFIELLEDAYFRSDLLAGLDKVLADYPTSPCIHWRFNFATDAYSAQFAGFARFMDLGIP
ncbi:hypothetical protein C8R44DRAFT_728777 [Mycena epipterygia]|nr:hypothetical protein C8R44DRAFT_728777 [Mycena epipterygia]